MDHRTHQLLTQPRTQETHDPHQNPQPRNQHIHQHDHHHPTPHNQNLTTTTETDTQPTGHDPSARSLTLPQTKSISTANPMRSLCLGHGMLVLGCVLGQCRVCVETILCVQ